MPVDGQPKEEENEKGRKKNVKKNQLNVHAFRISSSWMREIKKQNCKKVDKMYTDGLLMESKRFPHPRHVDTVWILHTHTHTLA